MSRPTSAAIEAVRRGTRSLADFWSDVAAGGAPLVEAGDDADHRLLTFVWRGEPGPALQRVAVVGGPATWRPIDDDLMENLAGTDLWWRTYRVRADLAGRYWLSPNDSLVVDDGSPGTEDVDWAERESTFVADPFNPLRLQWPAQPSDPSSRAHDCSVLPPLDGSPVPSPAPWTAPATVDRPLVEHRVTGDAGEERAVWVREPAAGPARAVVVLFDGWVWANVLPVADPDDVLFVMVDALDDRARDRDLACNPRFVDFLLDHVVPAMRREHGVAAEVPVVVAGQSYGGLAAAFAAHHRPADVHGAVIQSGSFWFERDTPYDERSEWLTAEYARAPRGSTRFSVAIGLEEGPEMLRVERHFRDVLVARGDVLTYREYMGGHDWLCWHRLLPTMIRDVLDHAEPQGVRP